MTTTSSLSRSFPTRRDTWPRRSDGPFGSRRRVVDGGGGAAGDTRRACRCGGQRNCWACPTSATRSTWRRSGRSRSPTTATPSCSIARRRPAQAAGRVDARCTARTRAIDPESRRPAGRRRGRPVRRSAIRNALGRGESRGDGALPAGDRAARRTRSGPDRRVPNPRTDRVPALRSFHGWPCWRRSRLEERGDMDGAWGWYRAALRASYHFGLRGPRGASVRRCLLARRDPDPVDGLVVRPEDDPGDDAPHARRRDRVRHARSVGRLHAPGRVSGCHAHAGQIVVPGPQASLKWLHDTFESPGYRLNPEQVQAIGHAWRFLRREPERSRRVIRLAIANWLACYDLPPERRPKPDPKVSGFCDSMRSAPRRRPMPAPCRPRRWTDGS